MTSRRATFEGSMDTCLATTSQSHRHSGGCAVCGLSRTARASMMPLYQACSYGRCLQAGSICPGTATAATAAQPRSASSRKAWLSCVHPRCMRGDRAIPAHKAC